MSDLLNRAEALRTEIIDRIAALDSERAALVAMLGTQLPAKPRAPKGSRMQALKAALATRPLTSREACEAIGGTHASVGMLLLALVKKGEATTRIVPNPAPSGQGRHRVVTLYELVPAQEAS